MSIDFVSANGEKFKPLGLSKGFKIPKPTELQKQLIKSSLEKPNEYYLKEKGDETR